MGIELRYCPFCKRYTLYEKCPICGNKTIVKKPPKYSPDKKDLIVYRILQKFPEYEKIIREKLNLGSNSN